MSHVDHDVDSGLHQRSGVSPEELPHPPPGAVANHGAAEAPRGRDAQTTLLTLSRKREEHKIASGDLNTLPVDRLELAPPA